jgi:hypothetical protein
MTRPDHTAVPPAGVIAAAVGAVIDHMADNWPVKKYSLEDIEDRLRAEAPAIAARAEGAAPTAAQAAWISMADRLPDDGHLVLVLCRDPHDPEPGMWAAQWLAGSETFESHTNGWVHADEVSHWMQLPALPASHAPHATLAASRDAESATSGATSGGQEAVAWQWRACVPNVGCGAWKPITRGRYERRSQYPDFEFRELFAGKPE